MLPKILSFVDVETTGMSSQHGRIIEIAIIRVEDNKIVDEYKTLINPNTYVDPFILSMTGINQKELERAPTFYEVSKRIKELLSGSLFVAHNVLFDYSFIKREFERLEMEFVSKQCCSVKLSRALYPKFKRHNLDALIERFNFKCLNRHRAYDDAKVIWDFYRHSIEKFGEDKFLQSLNKVMKRPSLPINISEDNLESLPEGCGVYIFYNKDNVPLYVGKSKNIRTRVMSHFSNSKESNKDMKIAQNIHRIETIDTAGELGALLLEATLVKKLSPLYNRQLRYAYKLLAIKKIVTEQKYNSISIEFLQEIPFDQLSSVLGIFKSRKEVKSFLQLIAKDYGLCLKLLDLEKTSKNCFNFHLNLCKGACDGKEIFLKYNLRFDEAFSKSKIKDWPYKGPIGLKEKQFYHQNGLGKEEVFVIDKWCVLGKLDQDYSDLDQISQNYYFDTDTYKILNRYLKSNQNLEIFQLNFRDII